MENLNTIVTITCSRDFEAMKRQARSIDLFVIEQCTHFVVIEDISIGIDTWKLELQPFYARHKLVLLTADDFNINLKELREINGWLAQQLLKIYIVSKITTEFYLVLDSKNFFIKHISLKDWPVTEGNGMSNEILPSNKWNDFVKYISDVLNIPIPDKFFPAHTPFIFRTSVVKEIINTWNLVNIVFKFKGGYEKVSEFNIYRFFSLEPLTVVEFYKTFWPGNAFPTTEEILKLHVNPAILMLGLHNGLYEQKPLEFQELIQFIEDTIFKPVISS